MLARTWSRIRQRECARWGRPIDQQALWGNSSPRRCERATWLHNSFVAHAKISLEEAGPFYADLSKYDEHIGHFQLKGAAQAWGFNLGLLRAPCCTFRAPRRARISTCLSGAVNANGT
eukprot:1343949-Pyramimonas_sp.AAC.1